MPVIGPMGYRQCNACKIGKPLTTLYNDLSFCKSCMNGRKTLVLTYIAQRAGISRKGKVFARLQAMHLPDLNHALVERAKRGAYIPEPEPERWAIQLLKGER